jgi:hypothetical protein
MPVVKVELSTDMVAFADRAVSSGRYKKRGDVVWDAMRELMDKKPSLGVSTPNPDFGPNSTLQAPPVPYPERQGK